MQQGSNGTSMLTDEQILDMELAPGGNGTNRGTLGSQAARNEPGVILSEAKDLYVGNGGNTAREIFRRSAFQNDSERDMALLTDDVTARADEGASGASQDATSGVAASDATANGDPARVAATNGGPASAASVNGNDPAWLTSLEAQPQGGLEAAAEARAWRAAATDVASLDAAYFSADAGTRSGLAERLYDSDPGAFRAMLAESARTMAQRDPQGLADLAHELGAATAVPLIAAGPRTLLNAINNSNSQSPSIGTNSQSRTNAADSDARGNSGAPVARVARQDISGEQESYTVRDPRLLTRTGAENASGLPTAGRPELQNPALGAREDGRPDAQTAHAVPAFPAEAYRSFEAATNEDVARRVHRAIDHTLSTTLPDGMAEGARRRIAEDIFQEVHASLAADRDLGRRLGETLRDWRFDAAARQQVSSLLAGRARAVLPEVARRVVAEWTSSVLASDRAKTARIDAATSRRDITGGRLPEPVPASSLRPLNIDYHRVSDEQIMEM